MNYLHYFTIIIILTRIYAYNFRQSVSSGGLIASERHQSPCARGGKCRGRIAVRGKAERIPDRNPVVHGASEYRITSAGDGRGEAKHVSGKHSLTESPLPHVPQASEGTWEHRFQKEPRTDFRSSVGRVIASCYSQAVFSLIGTHGGQGLGCTPTGE